MERKSFIWLIAFVLLAALELIGEIGDNRSLILFTKPLLMPVLAIWLVQKTAGIRRFFRHTIQAGLLFAMLGDIFMMFSYGAYDELFFILGLGAFMCTHLCYLGGFISEIKLKSGYLRRQPLWLLPFLLFIIGFLIWLWPKIPVGMQQPVTVYALVISTMALTVVNTYGKFSKEVFTSLLIGALLFILSDCLIAAFKFGHPFPGVHMAIMLTYLLGQWLIVRGVAEHLRNFPAKPE